MVEILKLYILILYKLYILIEDGHFFNKYY